MLRHAWALFISTQLCSIAMAGRGLRGVVSVVEPTVEIHGLGQSMLDELAANSTRLDMIEAVLRPMYEALPKVRNGGLSHSGVRYALHRFFMQRHQWFVRGLDPSSDHIVKAQKVHLSIKGAPVIPTILQKTMEQKHVGTGLNLKEMSVLAAAIEDLANREVHDRLQMAYEVLGFDPEAAITPVEANLTISTFMSMFLLGHRFSNWTAQEILQKEKALVNAKRWKAVYRNWIRDIVANSSSQFGFDTNRRLDLSAMRHIIDSVSDGFGTLTAGECGDLKTQLLSLEGRLPGRVRLSDFYNASKYHAWSFTESIEYLRRLGALDESNATNPQVIIVNYMTSMPQCLQATGMYSVCCPDECEGLLAILEKEIGAPAANVETLREMVQKLSSSTVEAPRQLSKRLADRLWDMTDDQGLVPLHGRLFAQWMHHAFPRECPYPHKSGTTSPTTADEWIEETGQDSQASDEEMSQHIRPDDTCGADAGHAELPWSHAEELVIHEESPSDGADWNEPKKNRQSKGGTARTLFACIALAAFGVNIIRMFPDKMLAKLSSEQGLPKFAI